MKTKDSQNSWLSYTTKEGKKTLSRIGKILVFFDGVTKGLFCWKKLPGFFKAYFFRKFTHILFRLFHT